MSFARGDMRRRWCAEIDLRGGKSGTEGGARITSAAAASASDASALAASSTLLAASIACRSGGVQRTKRSPGTSYHVLSRVRYCHVRSEGRIELAPSAEAHAVETPRSKTRSAAPADSQPDTSQLFRSAARERRTAPSSAAWTLRYAIAHAGSESIRPAGGSQRS